MQRSLFAVLFFHLSSISPGQTTQSDYLQYVKVGQSVSTGGRVYLKDPRISIELPHGWKVYHDIKAGVTLVARGRKQRVNFGKNIFKLEPTISIKTIDSSDPVDDIEERSFINKLEKIYSGKFDDFSILQFQRIDFKGVKDALVVYSTYSSHEELSMFQMHLLVASGVQQYVVSYTNAEKLIRDNDVAQDKAWQYMTSIDFDGQAPSRYEAYFGYGKIVFWVIFIFKLMTFTMKIKQRKILHGARDEDDFGLISNEKYNDTLISEEACKIESFKDDDDDFIDDFDEFIEKDNRDKSKESSTNHCDMTEFDDIDDWEISTESGEDDDGWAI